MTTFKLLGAAAILSALVVSSASAQAVIDEPGMYAFYHPNGDVLHAGSPRPALEAQAMAPRLVMRHALPVRHVRSAK
jgi:hypothetical protein